MSTSKESRASELLEQARAGDMTALEELLKTVQPQIYRFGMKMCRHAEDAEDVLQDTMLAVARSVRDFRGNSSMSTWLYSIARNSCVKKRRKSKYAPAEEESLEELERSAGSLESADEDPHTQVESKQAWEQVGVALQKLDPEHREVLLLRDVEGLSAKEVAEVIGVSVAAVKSRLHRARSELREQLAPAAASEIKPGCVDIRTIFSQHLEGELASEICSTMEAHVENCPQCEAECKGLNEALQICRTSPCDAPPAATQARVDAAIRTVLAELN
jgi:RNA polymerase sigma-70 factor (ECF subfamily)